MNLLKLTRSPSLLCCHASLINCKFVYTANSTRTFATSSTENVFKTFAISSLAEYTEVDAGQAGEQDSSTYCPAVGTLEASPLHFLGNPM